MEKTTDRFKYLDYIKAGVFYVVVGILVFYIVISLFAPEKTVKIFGFKPYVVITDSMEPYIMVNDLIIVKNPDVDELVVEDIITFYADINYDGENEIVTHYIYSINEDDDGDLLFKTHGYFENDADIYSDYWVIGEDDVLGQYSFKIPVIGAIVQFVKSPFGIAAMVVNIGVIAGIIYLIKKGDEAPKEVVEDKTE